MVYVACLSKIVCKVADVFRLNEAINERKLHGAFNGHRTSLHWKGIENISNERKRRSPRVTQTIAPRSQ